MKILVIEDNPLLSNRMKNLLKKRFIVELATSGHEAISTVVSQEFDIILLDLGLPDMPGIEVCQKLRELDINAPILVVTGIDETLSKVSLLNCGADDYITKPFDSNELHARIDALLRRKERGDVQNKIEVCDIVIDPSKRVVTRAGKLIELRRKEFDILEYLALNKGRVLSRQMIINHAWASTSTSWTGSVDVHIKQLRDKIDRPFATQIIKTTYGVGYSINTDSI